MMVGQFARTTATISDDILSFASAWTGFVEQGKRTNYELVSDSSNQLDPMRIRPDYHDHFPKKDLEGGYIGDYVKNSSSGV